MRFYVGNKIPHLFQTSLLLRYPLLSFCLYFPLSLVNASIFSLPVMWPCCFLLYYFLPWSPFPFLVLAVTLGSTHIWRLGARNFSWEITCYICLFGGLAFVIPGGTTQAFNRGKQAIVLYAMMPMRDNDYPGIITLSIQ